MKKPTRKPTKKRPERRSPAGKLPRKGKLKIIKRVLESSEQVASVTIVGRQRPEELFELFRGVREKWVVAFPPTMVPMAPIAKSALMAPAGGSGTVVLMMVKETAAANDI
jgi:hypothetical protein